MAFWRNVDCWIFVPDQGRLPLLDCKEGFRISRWPHSCLEKALPASAEPHELPNPFICHSQRAGWDERKRGPGFLVGFSKPDHHAFTRLHSTQIPERKCCMKSMLSLVTIYHEGKIQMFQCLSLKFEWEFHNQSHKVTNHFILAPFGFRPKISAQIDPYFNVQGAKVQAILWEELCPSAKKGLSRDSWFVKVGQCLACPPYGQRARRMLELQVGRNILLFYTSPPLLLVCMLSQAIQALVSRGCNWSWCVQRASGCPRSNAQCAEGKSQGQLLRSESPQRMFGPRLNGRIHASIAILRLRTSGQSGSKSCSLKVSALDLPKTQRGRWRKS